MTRLLELPPGFSRAENSVAQPLRNGRHPTANYWYFHSNKLDVLLLIESDVLFATVVILEFRSDVLSYAAAPEPTDCDGPESAADLKVCFVDGHTELWWCRRDLPHSNWRPTVPDNVIARVITAQDIEDSRYQFDNALMLSGAMTAARSYDCSAACYALLNKFEVQPNLTVAEAWSIPGFDPAILQAALGQILADGTLVADLETQLLSPGSIIRKGAGRAGTGARALLGALVSRSAPVGQQEVTQEVASKDAFEWLPGGRRRLIPYEYQKAVWPTPDIHEVPNKDRHRYQRRKAIVDAYRRGKTYRQIARKYSVSEGEIRRLINRCVRKCVGGIYGYFALIPGRHLAEGTGKTAEGRKIAPGSGNGKWSQLLETIEGLGPLIRDCALGSEAPSEGRDFDIDDIHRQVLELLEQEGVSSTEYPLTNADRGRDAVARHVRSLAKAHLLRYTRVRYGESSEKRARYTGHGLRRIIRPLRPCSFVQLDYWMTGKLSKIGYPNRFGEVFDEVLPKWYYAVLVDELFSSVLSGFPTLEVNPSSESALECLDRFMHPELYWRSDFSGHRAMDSAACLAGEIMPKLQGTRIDVLRVDNAWANQSDAFIRAAVYQYGAAVNFGATYTWVTRAVVERVIGNIAQLTGQTVGPQSVVDLGHLRLALDEACRSHNVTRTARLNHSSPASATTYALQQQNAGVIAPPLPRETVKNGRLLDHFFVSTVRGNLDMGVRPYIQTLRRRYVGGALEQAIELLPAGERTVQVEGYIKRYDVRICEANIVDGQSLGKLTPDRQQDVLISVRDATALQSIGSKKKMQDKLEQDSAKHRTNVKGKGKGKSKTKCDPDALRQAREDQRRALQGARTVDTSLARNETPTVPVNTAPVLLKREPELVLTGGDTQQAAVVVVTRKSLPQEAMLRPWSSPSSPLPKTGGDDHEPS
ncbi:hypothetical protein ACMAVI_001860 [Burkholderia cenocepacia]